MKLLVDVLLDGVEWKPIVGCVNDGSGMPYATHEGTLRIGDRSLSVVQLNDGRRVIDAEAIEQIFGEAK